MTVIKPVSNMLADSVYYTIVICWLTLYIILLYCVCIVVDYILKDPNERQRLRILQIPRVYPQRFLSFSRSSYNVRRRA